VASIATLDDLEPWLTIDNDERAEAVLAAASTLVQAKTGQAWVDADGVQLEDVDDDDFAAVKTVVVQVALRVYQNPLGVTQQSTGPFSRSVAAWAAFGLSLTPDERAMLPTTIDGNRPGLWTLGTTRYDEGLPDRYLDVVDQDEPIIHVPVGEVNW
jgi:hypothetical protein